MQDQAQRLRELVDSMSSARCISVTSGKGGVGKTNVVVNLAIALAKRNKSVVVVDADLGLANVDVLLNLNPRYNLYHVMERHKRLEDIMMEGPLGIKIVPGASGITRIADIGAKEREFLLSELASLQRQVDYIVVDTSAGINRNVINFVISSDISIIVTTPEPTAITDAYAMIKVIAQRKINQDVRLLVNMANSAAQAKEIFERISMVSRQFLGIYVEYAGCILKDDSIVEAVLQRKPFLLEYPYSPASRSLAKIANNIIGDDTSLKGEKETWLERLWKIFR